MDASRIKQARGRKKETNQKSQTIIQKIIQTLSEPKKKERRTNKNKTGKGTRAHTRRLSSAHTRTRARTRARAHTHTHTHTHTHIYTYIYAPTCSWSSWCNCNGWLGVKHQVTYLIMQVERDLQKKTKKEPLLSSLSACGVSTTWL